MSKLIKSNQVKIGDEKLIIPSAITISTEDYLGMHPKGMPSRVSSNYFNDGETDEDTFTEEGWINHTHRAHPLSPEEEVQRMLDQAQTDADLMLEVARESAVAIESESLDQVKTLYEKTFQEATEAGSQKGYEEGYQRANQLILEALEIKAHWKAQLDALIPDLEAQAIHLVLACVEKVLGEMVGEPTYVGQLLKVGFERMAHSTSLEIRVCERDYDYALTLREKVLALSEGVDDIQFKVDYALEPGQLIVETSRGVVDLGVQGQLEKIRQLFESMLESDSYA